jgi:ABC-type branched-subunit amino acid transport system substrate-binding protein
MVFSLSAKGGIVRKHHRAAVVAALLTVALVLAQAVSASAQSDDKPTASDVGVTADTIRIGVVADNDNAFVPGIFKGASDAVQGAAKYINANGGIAGRKLVVDVYDSKLNANEARNSFIAACDKDFALVGTTALFVTTFDDVINCKDSKGQATGMPDVAGLVTSQTEACSPVTYSPNAPQVLCDTVTQDPPTYQGDMGPFLFAKKQLKNDAHGALLTSNDTPDAQRSGQANMALVKKAGVKPDVEVSLSSRDPQSAFTPVVQKMKADNSNFSYLTMSLNSAIQLRQEATLQGIPADQVTWLCPSTCYDHEAMAQAGSTMDGEKVFLTFLPFEEVKANKMLANFVKYTGKDKIDGFGVSGWTATILFQQALTDAVKQHGVNGVTRANLLTALQNTHSFNSGGMIGTTDVGKKIVTPCYLMLEWNQGKYTRVNPKKQGTFDCTKSNYTTVKATSSG